LAHPWLKGETATDHNLLPEIKQYMAKARLRRGIERVKLANRIDALKIQDDDPEHTDIPADAVLAADQSHRSFSDNADKTSSSNTTVPCESAPEGGKRTLSKAIKGAIFREVVMAKVREMKEQEQIKETEEALKVAEIAEKDAKRRSYNGSS
jgi:calcium/calmodulin-dependent protein kinase I